MNKSILWVILCGTFLFSCKKDKKTPDQPPQPPQSKERKLTFTINGFSQSTGPVTNSAGKKVEVNSIQDSSIITYVLLDSANTVLKILSQASTDASFGTITDTAPPGTYYVAFMASEMPASATDARLTYKDNGRFNYSTSSNVNNAWPWRDLLFAKSKIVVSDHDISANFTLTRVVGKIELEVLDAIPASVNVLAFQFTETTPFFSVITGKFIPSQVLNPSAGSGLKVVAGSTGNKMIAYTATLNKSFPVTITGAYLPPGSLTQTIVVKKTGLGITCQANKLTLISGYLFSNTGSINISVGDWNPSETIPF